MLLLDILPEIFSLIMETLVIDDLEIAMQRRLVCKRFDHEIFLAICNTRAFESTKNAIPYHSPYHTSASDPQENLLPYYSTRLNSEYLIHRTLRDRFRQEIFSQQIGDIVDYIIAERPQDADLRDEYTRNLCIAAVDSNPPRPRKFVDFNHRRRYALQATRLRDNKNALLACVMSASAVLGLRDLFHDCAEKGVTSSPYTLFGTPLRRAVIKGDMEMIDLMLLQDYDFSHSRFQVINSAARRGNLPILQKLLATEQPVKFKDAYPHKDEMLLWRFALRFSIEAGQLDTTDYLAHNRSYFINPEHREAIYGGRRVFREGNRWMQNPPTAFWYDVVLSEAAGWGHENLVRWALDKGAGPNANVSRYISHHTHMNSGENTLELAARSGSDRIVSLLLAAGARTGRELLDPSGKTFLRVVSEGWTKIIKILIEKGVDLSAKCSGAEKCPTLAAVKRGRIDCLQLLLNSGLKVDIGEGCGKMAYEYADSHGYTTIMHLLSENSIATTERA